MTSGHRALPHCADVVLEAWGPTREACIAEAVAALVESFVDTVPDGEQTTRAFRIPVSTPQAALVSVLEEALYVSDMSGQAPVSTTVSSIAADCVEGSFRLAEIADRDRSDTVPKGISLSGLFFDRDGAHWRCRFTVDV